MFLRLNKFTKSGTVKEDTNKSAADFASSIAVLCNAIFVPTAGGNNFTAIKTYTEAIKPVPMKVRTVESSIFLNLLIFAIFPTAVAIDTKTIGTTAVNIKFKKISPKGFSTLDFSGKNTPNKVPKIIPNNKITGKLIRSEEHTSELQSRQYLVCRLLLEKKK